MLNKRIRSLIDEIFSEMKMTAENLALRDELMANAQARYEDAVRQGRSEEEAFAEVAASLGDVQALLHEMNDSGAAQPKPEAPKAEEPKTEAPKVEEPKAEEPKAEEPKAEAPRAEEPKTEEPKAEAPKAKPAREPSFEDTDLGSALNKAFSALGDIGRQIVPQAKKLVQQMDEATGGALNGIGKAVDKGIRDAQKAAGDVIDRISGKQAMVDGEIVIDFGQKDKPGHPDVEKTPEDLRQEAATLRAQAQIKQVTGDEDGARELHNMADALDAQADAMETATATETATAAAGDAHAEESAQADAPENLISPDGEVIRPQDYVGADGELDKDAFSQAVDDMVRDANDAAGQNAGQDAEPTRRDGCLSFPSAGLRTIDVKVDEDDVTVEPSDDLEIGVCWRGISRENEPVVKMVGHALTIRRPNPDVFKTFFSVFNKSGGQIVIRVPRGYAADYALVTTSGDIHLQGVDVDEVKINSTSGDVRVEPDAHFRAKGITVSTVSGDVTVSACAEDISVNTVSGDQFISCDAGRVDVDGVSGDVHVEGAADDWEASTVSGDIALLCTVVPMRKMQISTVSGDAHVALPADIRGFVAEISGLSGSIENEFGPNRYGTCALPIHMDTMSGDLLITRL